MTTSTAVGWPRVDLQWREIPQAWGEAAWADAIHKGSAYPLPDGSDILLFKAKDGSLSFFKRTPTGSGSTTAPLTSGPGGESKPTYRYHYASGSGGLGGAHFDPKQNPEHFSPGAKHAAWGGHFTVHASDPKAGTVTVSHSADPSGAQRTMPVQHFAEHVKAYHAPQIEQHKQKLMGDLAHHQEKLAHHQEKVSSLAAAAKKHGYEVPAEAAPAQSAKSGKRYYPSSKGIYEVPEGVNEPGPHQRNLHPTRESAEKKAASRGWSTEHAGTFTKEAGKRGSPNWTPEAAMGAPPKGTPPTSQAAGAATGGLDWSGGAASYPHQRVEHTLPRSTNLQRTTWTPDKPGSQHGTMRVHFHNGAIHDYGNVHHDDYTHVVEHPTSHGQAFAERIKGAHPHRQVRGATPEGKKHASEIVAEAKKAAGEAKAGAANEKRAKEGLAPPAAAAKHAEPEPGDNEPFPMPEPQAAPAKKAPSKLDQAAAAAMPAEPAKAAEPKAPTKADPTPEDIANNKATEQFRAKIPDSPGVGSDAPTRKMDRPAPATKNLDAAAEKAVAPAPEPAKEPAAPAKRPAAPAELEQKIKDAAASGSGRAASKMAQAAKKMGVDLSDEAKGAAKDVRQRQLASAKAILAHPGMKREDEATVAGAASRNNLRDHLAEVLNTKPSQRVGYSATQAQKLVKERPDVLKHEGLKEAYEQAMDHHHGRKYQEAPAKPAKAAKEEPASAVPDPKPEPAQSAQAAPQEDRRNQYERSRDAAHDLSKEHEAAKRALPPLSRDTWKDHAKFHKDWADRTAQHREDHRAHPGVPGSDYSEHAHRAKMLKLGSPEAFWERYDGAQKALRQSDWADKNLHPKSADRGARARDSLAALDELGVDAGFQRSSGALHTSREDMDRLHNFARELTAAGMGRPEAPAKVAKPSKTTKLDAAAQQAAPPEPKQSPIESRADAASTLVKQLEAMPLMERTRLERALGHDPLDTLNGSRAAHMRMTDAERSEQDAMMGRVKSALDAGIHKRPVEAPKAEAESDKHAEALVQEPVSDLRKEGSDLPVARNRIRTWLSVLRDPDAEASTKATARTKLDDFVAKNEHVLGGSDPKAKALAEAHKDIAGAKTPSASEKKDEDPFERAQRVYGVSADDIAAVKKRRGEDVAKHRSAGRHDEANDMLKQALQTHLSQTRGWSIAHAGKWLREQEQGGAPAKKAAKKKP